MASSSGLILFEQILLEHTRSVRGFVQFSSKMSHPPNTTSSSEASGTKSLMSGERPSVRFPRRTCPSASASQWAPRAHGGRRGRQRPWSY